MKRVVLMVVLALALPLAAFAGNVDFGNMGGTLTGTAAGLSLTGSELTSVGGLGGGPVLGNLGSVTFTTGALTSGNLMTGATFAAGGSFTITGNGTDGIPSGVIFSGTFSGPVTWKEISIPGENGSVSYVLSGTVSGTYNGATVNGFTFQGTFPVGKNGWTGMATLSSGDTFIITTTVPEPGTLGLLGTGLVGLAGLSGRVRAKLKA